jgi:hypothetical protein
MKVHRRRIRLIKGLALAGCSLGLAVPTVASASPAGGPGPINGGRTAPVVVLHPHGRPVAVVPNPADFALPSSFKTDAQSQSAGAGSRTFVLPANHQTDAQTPPPSSAPTSTVVHEVRTIQSDDHTLAIVLAAAALGIALCGTGYALSRVALLQRRVPSSS